MHIDTLINSGGGYSRTNLNVTHDKLMNKLMMMDHLVIELILLFNDSDAIEEAVSERGEEDNEQHQGPEEEDSWHGGSCGSPEDGPGTQH